MNVIVPDDHGDWFNQRDNSYSRFMRLDGKKTNEKAIFKNFSCGVVTSRDAWAYGSSKQHVLHNIKRTVKHYNGQVEVALLLGENFKVDLDPLKMKWDRPQKRNVVQGKKAESATIGKVRKSLYRPFFLQFLYFDRFWNNCVYQSLVFFQ